MNKSFFCCLPESIYSTIKAEPCVISIKNNNNLDLINTNTNEIIVSLHFGSNENRTEVVYVNGNSIENSMPINQIMEISGKPNPLRTKTKKVQLKEKVQLDVMPSFDSASPVATMKSVSDQIIIKEHIQGTLEYIGENYSSNADKLKALTELSQFISSIKSIKQNPKFHSLFETLKESRRKNNIPDMKRALLVISNTL